MSGKRYYWLKLQDGFFTSKRIKKLRKLAGGDTFTIIYLKMQLLAMKTDGFLKWTGLEDDFASELALDLDEDPENVKVTLAYLISCGLVETSDNISFFLPWAVENTGSEGSSAERMRNKRAEQKLLSEQSRTMCAQSDGEKEIEIEKELELEIEKDNSSFLLEEKQEKEDADWEVKRQKAIDACKRLGIYHGEGK